MKNFLNDNKIFIEIFSLVIVALISLYFTYKSYVASENSLNLSKKTQQPMLRASVTAGFHLEPNNTYSETILQIVNLNQKEIFSFNIDVITFASIQERYNLNCNQCPINLTKKLIGCNKNNMHSFINFEDKIDFNISLNNCIVNMHISCLDCPDYITLGSRYYFPLTNYRNFASTLYKDPTSFILYKNVIKDEQKNKLWNINEKLKNIGIDLHIYHLFKVTYLNSLQEKKVEYFLPTYIDDEHQKIKLKIGQELFTLLNTQDEMDFREINFQNINYLWINHKDNLSSNSIQEKINKLFDNI